MGNSSPKGELIPHTVADGIIGIPKSGTARLTLEEEFAAYQLVGEVTAHQG